jgi:hypothetical protein
MIFILSPGAFSRLQIVLIDCLPLMLDVNKGDVPFLMFLDVIQTVRLTNGNVLMVAANYHEKDMSLNKYFE